MTALTGLPAPAPLARVTRRLRSADLVLVVAHGRLRPAGLRRRGDALARTVRPGTDRRPRGRPGSLGPALARHRLPGPRHPLPAAVQGAAESAQTPARGRLLHRRRNGAGDRVGVVRGLVRPGGHPAVRRPVRSPRRGPVRLRTDRTRHGTGRRPHPLPDPDRAVRRPPGTPSALRRGLRAGRSVRVADLRPAHPAEPAAGHPRPGPAGSRAAAPLPTRQSDKDLPRCPPPPST